MSHQRTTSAEAAKAVVRRNTEEVQSRGNFDVFEKLFADDFVDHTPQPNTTPDKEGVQTEKPLHRSILKNYLRHALLEISGYWDQILVPELTVPEPVYRVAERGEVRILTGHAAVEAFYRQVAETRTNVMAARTLNMCVDDFGVITEAVWNHMTPGAMMQPGEVDPDPDGYYLISHNIMQNFAYTHDAKLIGERVYDDPASYRYEKLEPADVVTPEMAREQLAPFLARATLD